MLGESGIGKTALLAEVARRARANGLSVLHGRGAEHERDVPFSLAIDALEDHADAGEIQALVTGDVLPAERFRHHRAVRGLLERLAERRPLALILDDLHWADDASVELVLHLLRRPPRGHVLLAFALRPVDPALRLLEAARTAPGWRQLTLEPLAHDTALALLEVTVRDLPLRERIAKEAAGNPLFLHELGAAAGRPGNELPRTLLATVALELAALDETSRTLVDGAAVAGERFDPELAVAAAGLDVPESALDALVAADLVRPSTGRVYCFRHPLVRRAVYDAAPPTWRLAAHERVAAVLEQRGSRAESRAFHVARFARQGDEQAIALLGQAGAAATATAPAAAARWYGTALKLLKAADVRRRAELLSEIAPALAAAGRLTESRDALVELLALIGPKPRLVAACAGLEAVTGQYASARARLLEALRHASAQERSALALELANCGFFTGEIAEIRQWAAHAAEAAGDEELLLADAEACGAVGALWQGETELAQ